MKILSQETFVIIFVSYALPTLQVQTEDLLSWGYLIYILLLPVAEARQQVNYK